MSWDLASKNKLSLVGDLLLAPHNCCSQLSLLFPLNAPFLSFILLQTVCYYLAHLLVLAGLPPFPEPSSQSLVSSAGFEKVNILKIRDLRKFIFG